MNAVLELPDFVLALAPAPRSAEGIAALASAGITHWAHHGRKPLVDVVVERVQPIQLLVNPVRDDGLPKPLDWYLRSLLFARRARAEKGHLLLSCSRGVHRSPSIAYAVLRVLFELTPQDAAARVHRAHAEASIRYAWDLDLNYQKLRAALYDHGPDRP